MRIGIYAITAVLAVPLAAQQRGVVTGVTVPKAPVRTGVPFDITISGTNPCGAVRIDPGDGTVPITHPIAKVPTVVSHVYQKAGRFEVRAEGMGNCDGVVTTGIDVSPTPAPPPAPPPAAPTSGVRAMDTDRDGVVTRAEWRGSDEAFRKHDTNDDGVLSGTEVRDDPNDIGVRAAERWTNTGVYVREGELVRIESAGAVQLSADPADTSSPGGAGSGRRAPSAPMPDRPTGALIARIGNGPPLFVGAESSLRANATGLLYLGVNDDHLADNRGEFRVKIDMPPRRYRR